MHAGFSEQQDKQRYQVTLPQIST